MTVLAFDWTLHDIERFCTIDQPDKSILTVDPTFNFGDFNVTVTTYRHPFLINTSGKHFSDRTIVRTSAEEIRVFFCLFFGRLESKS